MAVMVQPESSLSMLSVALVLMLSGVNPALPSCADRAMEKQPACAAAISSSGLVPGWSPKRVPNEKGVLENTPLPEETAPAPSFKLPFHSALALRCIPFSSPQDISANSTLY